MINFSSRFNVTNNLGKQLKSKEIYDLFEKDKKLVIWGYIGVTPDKKYVSFVEKSAALENPIIITTRTVLGYLFEHARSPIYPRYIAFLKKEKFKFFLENSEFKRVESKVVLDKSHYYTEVYD